MRTRLDEIADNILKHWHDVDASPTKLIRDGLSDAFRHGVERAFDPFWWKDNVRLAAVQPAPAEEKDVVPAPHCPIRCGGPHSRRSDGVFHCNNRKGERRKYHENWMLGMYEDVFGLVRFDRRTGKDRRK